MEDFNLAGRRFGRLTVLEYVGQRGHQSHWKCRCECGKETEVARSSLLRKDTRSCGCLRRERSLERFTTHGEANKTAEYRVWVGVLSRCYNKNRPAYPDYGGRGITVCRRWRTNYANFIKDMGRRPSPQAQIERRNNNGNYSPSNCYWSDVIGQTRNRRSNVIVEYSGVKMCLKDAAQRAGLPYKTVHARINQCGWEAQRALSEPLADRGQ